MIPIIDETKRQDINQSIVKMAGNAIEQIAEDAGASALETAMCLPEEECVSCSGDEFESIMLKIADWGPITFLIHTEDLIFEGKGEVPKGKTSRGYFNLMGAGPIGGHLKADRCAAIFFISRPFMGNETHSVQFYSESGKSMFKIYLGRDEQRQLIPQQIELYMELRAAYQ